MRERSFVVASLLAAAALSSAGVNARADETAMHRVTYSVTADQRTAVQIYYRDVDPPSWSDYSHNPYLFSPRDDADLGPGASWTRDVMLTDPMQWSMVAVTVVEQAPNPQRSVRCEMAVDSVVVDRADGPRGALCSLRIW